MKIIISNVNKAEYDSDTGTLTVYSDKRDGIPIVYSSSYYDRKNKNPKIIVSCQKIK